MPGATLPTDPSPTAAGAAAPALKLFISYSRSDKAAALALARALEAAGFDVYIDLERLEFGEEWQRQLSEHIAGADSVLWLVTPASVASRWCQWELHEVTRLSRRLLPLRMADIDLSTLPPALGRVHFLPAEGAFDLAAHLATLVQALHTDSAWIRQGTALLERARQWRPPPAEPGGTVTLDRSALLVGGQLRRADAWRRRQPPRAPAPAAEVVELILASRDAERRRRAWGLAAAMGAGAIVVAAWTQWQAAQQRRSEALANQSRQLLAAARQSLDAGDAVRAVLLVLQAMPDTQRGDDRPLLPEAESALYAALQALRPERVLKDPAGHSVGVMPGAAASAVPVLGQDHTLRLLDATRGTWTAEQRGPEALPVALRWSTAGRRLLVVSTGFDPDPPRAFLWDTQGPRLIGTLQGHDAEVKASAFSADGTRLALADDTGALTLHDARDGRLLRRWTDAGRITALALDRQGRWLAGAGDSGHTVLWDTGKPTPARRLAGCEGLGAQALYVSGDDRQLIAVCADGRVGRLALPGAPRLVADACTAPSLRLHTAIDTSVLAGDALLFGDGSGAVTKLDLAADPCGGLAIDRTRLPGPLQAIDADAASRTAVMHTRDAPRGQPPIGLLHVWRAGDARPVPVSGHGGLAGMALVDEGRLLVSHGGAELRIRDPLTPAQRATFQGHTAWVMGVSVAAGGKRALSHGLEPTARLWDPATARQVAALQAGGSQVLASAFSKDGGTAWLLANDGRLSRWQAGDGALQGDTTLPGPALPSAGQFAPGAQRLLVARGEHPAELWDPATGRRIAVLQPPAGPPMPTSRLRQHVARAVFSADGRWLVTVAEWATPMPAGQASASGAGQVSSLLSDGTLNLWDAQTGAWVRRIAATGDDIQAIALDPEGRRLAVALRAGRIELYALADGRREQQGEMPAATGTPRWAGIVFSADGRQLALSYGGNAEVWRLADGRRLRLARGVMDVGAPAFTPDAHRLVTRDGRMLRLWDLDTGEAAAAMEGHAQTVSTLAFDASGSWAISGSVDRDLRRWPLHASREALQARAWASVPRCLTDAERQQLALPAATGRCLARGVAGP